MSEKRVSTLLRMGEPLRRLIEHDAREHGISMNQEIINRLQKSLDEEPNLQPLRHALKVRGIKL